MVFKVQLVCPFDFHRQTCISSATMALAPEPLHRSLNAFPTGMRRVYIWLLHLTDYEWH